MNVPIRDLLPQYIKTQRWIDLADAIDAVFQNDLEMQTKGLEYIRHQYVTNANTDERAQQGRMIRFVDYDMPDRITAAMQTNILGLSIADSSFVGRDGFVNLTRNLGTFWFSKGLPDFVDFMGYVLNAHIEMINMWTQDYVHFVPEDIQGIGNTVYENNGTWYPTTHVRLRFDTSTLPINNVPLLVRLFYDLANYNLVLQAVEEALFFYMGTQGKSPEPDGSVVLDVLALGRVEHEIIEIHTLQ